MKKHQGDVTLVRGETQIEDMQTRHVLEKKLVQVLVGTTPNVLNRELFKLENTAPLTITDFKNGADGQRIHILGDGQTTIQDGTLIFTNTGANKLLAVDTVYSFTFYRDGLSHKWIEDAGGSGGGGGGVTSASNVGTGAEVFKQLTGSDLEFRTLVAGANVTITENADDIEIAASGGGSSGRDNPVDDVDGTAALSFDPKRTLADDTTLPAGATWMNQGASTFNNRAGAGLISAPTGSVNIRGIHFTLPGAPVIMRAKLIVSPPGGTNDHGGGLYLRESSSGRLFILVNYSTSTGSAWITQRWNSATSFASTLSTVTLYPYIFLYFEIEKVGATTYTTRASRDGRYWRTLLSAHDLSGFMTPDEIGFATVHGGATGPIGNSCEWLRVWT
jgi:hypothetical protein